MGGSQALREGPGWEVQSLLGPGRREVAREGGFRVWEGGGVVGDDGKWDGMWERSCAAGQPPGLGDLAPSSSGPGWRAVWHSCLRFADKETGSELRPVLKASWPGPATQVGVNPDPAPWLRGEVGPCTPAEGRPPGWATLDPLLEPLAGGCPQALAGGTMPPMAAQPGGLSQTHPQRPVPVSPSRAGSALPSDNVGLSPEKRRRGEGEKAAGLHLGPVQVVPLD